MQAATRSDTSLAHSTNDESPAAKLVSTEDPAVDADYESVRLPFILSRVRTELRAQRGVQPHQQHAEDGLQLGQRDAEPVDGGWAVCDGGRHEGVE